MMTRSPCHPVAALQRLSRMLMVDGALDTAHFRARPTIPQQPLLLPVKDRNR
jgi:hypothetical protein